jgi:Zn-dependent peptidase ImmA (M78 family)
MKIHGETRPPLINEPEKSEFVKSRKAKIIYADMNKIDGYLDVCTQGFSIIVNKNLSETRKRSIIAHELGHTFLFDIQSNPIKPYLQLEQSMKKRWESMEGLVSEIGRQILVPKAFLERYRYLNPSLKSFQKLRKIFNVTVDIMARRLVHDSKFWDVFIFVSGFDENSKKLAIPMNKNRFKSKKSFSDFNLNENWNVIQQESAKSYEDKETKKIEIGKKRRTRYKIEAHIFPNSSIMLCMISPLPGLELDNWFRKS